MRTRLLVLVTATISTILVAAPANAAGTVVTGAQTPVFSGPCFDATDAFSTTMDGGLLGCWYGDTFVLTSEHPTKCSVPDAVMVTGPAVAPIQRARSPRPIRSRRSTTPAAR